MANVLAKVAGLACLAQAIACGGSGKTSPVRAGGPAMAASDPDDGDGIMVPPEKFDELNQVMSRRRPVVSRCFAAAIEDGKLDKNAKGTVTLGLVVKEDGSPREVRVLESTLKSGAVETCVVKEIARARFTTLPKPVEFSYTYQFERDY
jgi:hypothetical protein